MHDKYFLIYPYINSYRSLARFKFVVAVILACGCCFVTSTTFVGLLFSFVFFLFFLGLDDHFCCDDHHDSDMECDAMQLIKSSNAEKEEEYEMSFNFYGW